MVGGLALQQLWLFWVGPVVGALIGGGIYRSLFAGDEAKPDVSGGAKVSQVSVKS